MNRNNLKEKLTQDIKQSIKEEFNLYNVEIDTNMQFKEIMFDYLNWRSRFIKTVPRKVFFSKEIKRNLHYKKYKKVIEKIAHKIKKGESLSSFLSKQVVHSPYRQNSNSYAPDKDNFLNAFGIHHLHIGEIYDNKETKGVRFVKRNNELLFIFIKEDRVYFIDIGEHNFGNLNLIRTIKRNWENLLKPYEMNYALDISNKGRSDKDIEQLLQAGITVMVPIDNKGYTLNAITTSGHNSNLHMFLNKLIIELNKLYTVLLLDEKYNFEKYKIVMEEGLLYLIDKELNKTIWIKHDLTEKISVDGYCIKGYHLLDFNY